MESEPLFAANVSSILIFPGSGCIGCNDKRKAQFVLYYFNFFATAQQMEFFMSSIVGCAAEV